MVWDGKRLDERRQEEGKKNNWIDGPEQKRKGKLCSVRGWLIDILPRHAAAFLYFIGML